MGYGVYWENAHQRFAGYGVPCLCEHPGCSKEINRGLGCLCGDAPGGGETGCGLYFCGEHLYAAPQQCERCYQKRKPFAAKPDTKEWTRHMMRDKTWKQWRDENPRKVAQMKKQMKILA